MINLHRNTINGLIIGAIGVLFGLLLCFLLSDNQYFSIKNKETLLKPGHAESSWTFSSEKPTETLPEKKPADSETKHSDNKGNKAKDSRSEATQQDAEKDKHEVIRWLLVAAEQGHVKAQLALGTRYYDGNGVEKSIKTAAKWFHKAARQGYAEAQFRLGVLYWHIKKPYTAYTWVTIAQLSGHKIAKKELNKKVLKDSLTPEKKASARKDAEKIFNEIESRRKKE